MAAWYAGSAFLLILTSTGFLYWALATNLDQEDRRTLGNTVADLRLLLRASPDLRLPEADGPGSRHTFRQPQEILVRIVDAEGSTLIETPSMSEQLPTSVFPSPSEIAPGAEISSEIVSPSGRLFQTLSATVATDTVSADRRVMQVAMDRADEDVLLVHYRERMWLALAASVVLCAVAGYAIARVGLRPIKRIVGTARRIRSATLHERIDSAGLPSELQSLAETFNEMLDRLEDSFAQVSQFSADVAHELRTPINNLVGEIEVTLGKSRSAEEYRETLGSALEECARIGQVIQSLLFLARAETIHASPHHESIDVRRELEAIREFYEATASEAGVELVLAPGPDIRTGFDRTLFQQAVGNLVANSLGHTPRGGAIEMRADGGCGRLRVEVQDTGRGIPPEHLPHVFDRFYRADKARTGTVGNVGLGLAVVRSIAKMHGGTVAIESQAGLGTCVTLEAPLEDSPSRNV